MTSINFFIYILSFFFFFFFQAEDGIRDLTVTGVQTCALPIFLRMYSKWSERRGFRRELFDLQPGDQAGRSEERRVGKSVDLGGRRIIKKKKRKKKERKKKKRVTSVDK